MAKVRGAIVVDVEKCKGCEVCIPACPTEVIALANEVKRQRVSLCLYGKS